MALNLSNISETESRLHNNVANKNRVQSNMLKLERKLRDIKEENRKLKDEKMKLRRLKKEIDVEKQQIETQKTSIQKEQEKMKQEKAKHKKSPKLMVNDSNKEQRKENKSLQRSLSQITMELNATKKKLSAERRKSSGDTEKKLKTMQRRYNAEKKNNKIMKRELDAVIAELAINKRKMNTAQRKGTSKGNNNAKYKALLTKWIKAQNKLTLAMMEFEDRANLYRRKEANFKKKQKKWLKQQKAMLKNKKMAIKYVFIDDISAITINSRYKKKIKVITKNGKTMLINNININHEKRNKAKGKNNDASWLQKDQIMQQILEETAINDDIDDGFDNYQVIRGDITDWKEEMAKRNEDLSILMSIAMNYNDGDRSEHLNFDELITGIVERNKERFCETDGDKELNKDLENEEKKRKNDYSETDKLLKTNCDEYLDSLQNAISNIQSITQTNTASKQNRVSIIKRKSMQSPESPQQSSLSPITSPVSVPGLMNGLSPISAYTSSFEFSDDQLAMFNPYSIAQELSTFYLDELDARSKDIKLMIQIFYSSYSDKDSLKNINDIIKGIDERIDDVEDNDALVVKYIANMENWKAQFQEYAIRIVILMHELTKRRHEIKQLFDVIEINKENKAFINRIESLSQTIDIRHQNVPKIIDNARYEVILGAKKKSDSDNDDDDEIDLKENEEKSNIDIDLVKILENMNGLQNENEEWKSFIDKLKAEANKNTKDKWKYNSVRGGVTANAPFKIIQNSVKRSMEEIEARTADIKQLKLVLLSKDSETAGDLLNRIEDRHNDLNKTNDDIIKSHENCTEYCISEQKNSLWWKTVEDIVLNNKIMNKKRNKESDDTKLKVDINNHRRKRSESITLSLMKLSLPTDVIPSVPHRKGTVRGVDYNENLSYIIQNDESKEDIDITGKLTDDELELDDEFEEEDEGWWLMLDEDRNTFIESINITTATNNTLSKLAIYISRILKSETDKVIKLYIPIDLSKYPSSQFRALATLFDGFIIAKLLCLINEDYIDFRAIHKPNTDKPFPLKRNEINENISVILSTLKSMRINLNELYSIKDWWDVNKHCKLLIDLLRKIASHTLDRFCSYKKDKELLLLKKKTETVSSLSYINGEKWIIRWINYLLNRNGENNINIDNDNVIRFNKDIIHILGLLKNRNSMLLSNPNATKYDNAKTFIKIAKTSFNIDSCIEAQDFVNNNRFCENYFAAQIFNKQNGLKLPQNMEMEQNEINNIENDSIDNDAMIAWLNSFGLMNRIDSLDDIGSGVTLLKVLDRLKKGVINWKKVHLKVRHKFDRVINCNYVVDICSKDLGLKFVNISGMDIVEKNSQIIKSILWRIMRYQSIKILSDLKFGSNINKVNNGVIIKWCNDKLSSTFGENIRCKQIKKINDSSLTTGIYYLELMRAVMAKAVDDDLIHFNVPPLSSSLIKKQFNLQLQSHDNHYKKRKENLKYAMTIIRRYGVDLFINVDDLFHLESRAVVTVLAAVMTISLSSQHIKNEEKEEKKEDKEQSANIINVSKSKNKSNNNAPHTPLKMANVDDIDIDDILDSVDSLYKK